MTTTRRPSLFTHLYDCTATQPPCPACSMMFWQTSDSVMAKPMIAFDSSFSSFLMIACARSCTRPTTLCTSSLFVIGVMSSSVFESPLSGRFG